MPLLSSEEISWLSRADISNEWREIPASFWTEMLYFSAIESNWITLLRIKWETVVRKNNLVRLINGNFRGHAFLILIEWVMRGGVNLKSLIMHLFFPKHSWKEIFTIVWLAFAQVLMSKINSGDLEAIDNYFFAFTMTFLIERRGCFGAQ